MTTRLHADRCNLNAGLGRSQKAVSPLGCGLPVLWCTLFVRPPAPEWGIMVADGAAYIISGEWWVWLFPGLALTSAVLAFNVAGDGLRDFFDPQRRS